jgi:hypothetical protein
VAEAQLGLGQAATLRRSGDQGHLEAMPMAGSLPMEVKPVDFEESLTVGSLSGR